MKLKEFIKILQDEKRICQEAEVNYVIIYNPYKNYIRFEEETDENV
jgi:hypothetical protein